MNFDTSKTFIEKGISIVIPMHDALENIDRLINNLNSLEIKDAKFEVIFVLNGSFEREYEYLLSESIKMRFDYKILISDKKGAPSARNLGKKYVRYSHVTFLDADDLLSKNYIQESFNLLKDNTILVAQIHNIDLENNIDKFNRVNKPLLSLNSDHYSVNSIHAILGITTCKFIPYNYIEQIDFNESLLSGEDTVFYCELYAEFNPNIEVIPIERNVIYYRYLSKNSISRGKFSYDFNISQRLDILDVLDKLLDRNLSLQARKFIHMKYNAQTGFIVSYIKEFPEIEEKLKELLKLKNYRYLRNNFLNNGRATELVIAYCFPPFIDTSGIVMAKRISQNNKIVDVFSNDMTKNRDKDGDLIKICSDKIDKHMISKLPVSFANINVLSGFIDQVFSFFLKNREKYNTVYSRAMFPVSHFPPLFIKLFDENIKWTAEFSDPLLLDSNANVRNSEINGFEMLIESLKQEIKFSPFKPYLNNNLFNLAELIPFAFADELVFTNEHQLISMTERFDDEVQQLILEKSIISNHPVPRQKLYAQYDSTKFLNKNEYNIGYFGGFYDTRSLKMLVELVEKITQHTNYKLKFHIFTTINQLKKEDFAYASNNPNINIYKNVSYFEFLNLTTKMDALLIFDAKTKGIKTRNPYLPSKLADYLGSKKPILAIVEEGSILDKIDNILIKKVNYDELNTDILNDIINDNIDRLDRKIDDKSTINNINYFNMDIEHTDFFTTQMGNFQIIFKPLLPILKERPLQIKLTNNTKHEIKTNLKSTYRDPLNVLKVFSNRKDFDNRSINQFNNGIDINLKPGEFLTLVLNYNKDYNKESFKQAGTLILQRAKIVEKEIRAIPAN